MIAYKTYSVCPPSLRDLTIPNELVWISEEIADHLKDEYEAEGYTVVTLEGYRGYLLSIDTIVQPYLLNEQNKLGIEALNLKIKSILQSNQIEGLNLIVEFGKRNMLTGKTEDQVDMIMEDMDVIKLCLALISGSYKYALRKSAKINNPAITESDKQYFIEKITDLLTRK